MKDSIHASLNINKNYKTKPIALCLLIKYLANLTFSRFTFLLDTYLWRILHEPAWYIMLSFVLDIFKTIIQWVIKNVLCSDRSQFCSKHPTKSLSMYSILVWYLCRDVGQRIVDNAILFLEAKSNHWQTSD